MTEKKHIIVNGHSINYIDMNQSLEKAILFIHGNSLSKTIFKNQLESEQLTGYRLLALDLPGHGDSEWIDSYSVNQIVRDIENFCEQLKLEHFILVGHSLGGHMSIQALPKLKNCTGIFLIGTPPLKLPLNIEEAFIAQPAIPLLFKKELTENEIQIFGETLTIPKHQDLVKEKINTTDTNFREQLLISIQEGQMQDEVEILNTFNLPVVLVFGEDDVLVNKEYVTGLHISNLYFKKPIFISKSTHIPHLENADDFNDVLKRFILELQ